MRIAFFGPDATSTTLIRRIQMMERLGHDVIAFTFRREENRSRGWKNIDLGRTYDAKYIQRVMSIRRAIREVRQHPQLSSQDVFWARNLEMLAIAVAARRDVGSHAPIVYETLDIHRLLTKGGFANRLMRRSERQLLRHVSAIVTSSPAYEREYFNQTHPEHPPVTLIENKLPLERLPASTMRKVHKGPLRFGWAGVLRCRRSFNALCKIAREAEGKIEVVMHGIPALDQIPDFEAIVQNTPHVTFHGAYKFPDDLPAIYGSMDIVWSGDYFQSGGGPVAIGNSAWALANRLYEGGYYGVPAIVPEGTEMANWVTQNGLGLTVAEPIEVNLPPLLNELKDGTLSCLKQALSAAPRHVFVDDGRELDGLLRELATK